MVDAQTSNRQEASMVNYAKKFIAHGLNYLNPALKTLCHPVMRNFRTKPMILFFHGVTERIFDQDLQGVHLDVARFEKAIQFLSRHYKVIDVNDYVEALAQNEKLDDNTLIIQFDDGYKNNLTTVLPIMKSYNVPFSVYVSSRHIEEGLYFPTFIARAALKYTDKTKFHLNSIDISIDDYRKDEWFKFYSSSIKQILKSYPLRRVNLMLEDLKELVPDYMWKEIYEQCDSDQPMNWAEVKQLHDSGVTIGGHCHDHCILHDNQAPQEIRRQLSLSKELIEKNVGPCSHFVYPNGSQNDISKIAVDELKSLGYQTGFTAIPGNFNELTSPYLLPRMCITTKVCDDIKRQTAYMYQHNATFTRWEHSF